MEDGTVSIDLSKSPDDFDAFLSSISSSSHVTSLTAKNCTQGAMRRLVQKLLEDVRALGALEVLDVSSDSDLKLQAEGASELAKCLRFFTRLTHFEIAGAA
jgi:hypothetical protein